MLWPLLSPGEPLKPGLLAVALLSCAVLQTDFASGQDSRRASLVGGSGNDMGWLGATGELYVASARVSLFAGLGYTPALNTGDASGLTAAGGARGYTRGQRHRGYVEASVSQVAIEQAGSRRFYGPGVQAGYQYTARSGFTALVSLGIGFIVASDFPGDRAHALGGIGVGYTWR